MIEFVLRNIDKRVLLEFDQIAIDSGWCISQDYDDSRLYMVQSTEENKSIELIYLTSINDHEILVEIRKY